MENVILTNMCMLCDKSGNILVQERNDKNWPGIAFPGGHVEQGESFVESVIREMYEETGYIVENPVLCGIKQFPIKGGRYLVLFYKADKFSGNLKSSSEGRVFWISTEKFQTLNLAFEMKNMAEVFTDPQKSEFYVYVDNGERKFKIF